MVSSITQDPYSIIISLNLASSVNLNIGAPPRPTELLFSRGRLISEASLPVFQRGWGRILQEFRPAGACQPAIQHTRIRFKGHVLHVFAPLSFLRRV